MAEEYARYTCWDNIDYSWIDMREARPRTRVRLADGVLEAQFISIDVDGVITCDESKVVLDTYQGDGYEAIRAEGEAYWAMRDRQRESEIQ